MTDFSSSPETQTLKPCPFCGEANVGFGRTGQKWQTVSCNECGAEGPCTEIDRDMIIAKWNTRTSDLAQRLAGLIHPNVLMNVVQAKLNDYIELQSRGDLTEFGEHGWLVLVNLQRDMEFALSQSSTDRAADGTLEALKLAEDVLSRAPFSTYIWPNGMHPQRGINQIREAISKLAPPSVSSPERNTK